MALLVLTACAVKTGGNTAKDAGSKAEVNARVQTTDNTAQSTTETAKAENNVTTPPTAPNKPQTATQTSQKTPAAAKPPAASQAPTTAKGKVVVIDPGHANRANLETEPIAPGSSVMKIKDGGGATGVVTKTPEYLVNMAVAMRLRTLLQQKGFTVVMTKTDNSVSLGNVERAEIGNNAHANLVIRIHADSSTNSSASGASMLIPEGINTNTKAIAGESKRCGQIVLDTLVKEVGMKDRGLVPRNDITGFNWSTVPVILVEMGFLSNPDEDRLLSSAAYEDRLARGLADGIAAALQ